MQRFLYGFWTNESGATAIEYALIAGIVSIAIIGSLHEIGPSLAEKLETVADNFNQ